MTELLTKTAYALPEPNSRTKLTDVRKGTPTGEYLRRYWHPIALAEEATELPCQVRALGEDLILFRDGSGKPGLVHPRCCHRGSSLFYGKVEQDGIRCCYHGWKFAVDGRCIDQPLEKDGGGTAKNAVRQPWYPVRELYGLIFAYMGPPDKMPVLPRYDCFEDIPEGTQLETDGNSFGSMISSTSVPFNWFQHYENIHDMGHAFWLHQFHSGPQFGEAFEGIPREALPMINSAVHYERSPRGVLSRTMIPHPDGRFELKVIETVLPNLRLVAAHTPGKLDHISWVLPLDETSFRILSVSANPEVFAFNNVLIAERSKLSQKQRQLYPGDFEAQGSQGLITAHNEEHLVSSDRGLVLLRRVFEEQVDLVAGGGDPINVTFDPACQVMQTEAGNWPMPEGAAA